MSIRFAEGDASFCIPATVDYYRAIVTTITRERLASAPQESIAGRFEYVSAFMRKVSDKEYENRIVSP